MSARKADERYALPGTGPTDEDLRHEVELTREELGDTVGQLVHKMDVKSRMRESAQRRVALLHDAISTATDRTHEVALTVRRHPIVVAGASLTAALLIVLLRLKR
jgi:Protein of unknown function (DUF3618)